MPCYEYRCPNGHTTEIIRRVAQADDPVVCHVCHLPAPRIEFSQTAPPRLVGEGFYKQSLSGALVNKPDVSKAVKQIQLGKGGNATLQSSNSR